MPEITKWCHTKYCQSCRKAAFDIYQPVNRSVAIDNISRTIVECTEAQSTMHHAVTGHTNEPIVGHNNNKIIRSQEQNSLQNLLCLTSFKIQNWFEMPDEL